MSRRGSPMGFLLTAGGGAEAPAGPRKYRTILLFGAPGSGKGTVGKALGAIPGFFHCACGDVFPANGCRPASSS